MSGSATRLGIEHLFVLMLENRSFDHMLGFSQITGMDAVTGQITEINGLSGAESNFYNGQEFRVSEGASYRVQADPPHEFTDVLHQLCGYAATYSAGGAYPAIDNSGYVEAYARNGGQNDPGEIMKCYGPEQLPVLNALACEFVVCDNWHASLPGPTWPNRFFVHAASSGGLDHSPRTDEIVRWETLAGFSFPNGTIFDALQSAGIKRRLYAGDDFPVISALKGIHLDDIRPFSLFASDLHQASFDYSYVFIEPRYDVLHEYRAGNSQHPLADVTQGESLIKTIYDTIRNSPVWKKSMLVITWDEHGGFYDHGIPPAATAPGDTAPGCEYNNSGFTFEQYGPRVPAVIVSPLIPKNTIDHRVYDHASIPATVESLFGLPALTGRDAAAARLDALITLNAARDDTPESLPAPAVAAAPAARPDAPVNDGNVPGILNSAMRQDLALAPGQAAAITARVAGISTRGEALQYLAEVQQKLRAHRA
ncbi:MAG: alkaline phosphatase family protein [Bryobacteraceae bacterium]